MKNSALWKLAEEGKVLNGDVFIDQLGNEIIYNGSSFKCHFTLKDGNYLEEVGLNVVDIWKFSHNEY